MQCLALVHMISDIPTFSYDLTPLIPLSLEGEGEDNKKGGYASLKLSSKEIGVERFIWGFAPVRWWQPHPLYPHPHWGRGTLW